MGRDPVQPERKFDLSSRSLHFLQPPARPFTSTLARPRLRGSLFSNSSQPYPHNCYTRLRGLPNSLSEVNLLTGRDIFFAGIILAEVI